MSWRLVFTRQAQKDAKKLSASGLKPKAETLLAILAADPFQSPPRLSKSLSAILLVPILGESISSIAWSIKCWRLNRSSKSCDFGAITTNRNKRASKRQAIRATQRLLSLPSHGSSVQSGRPESCIESMSRFPGGPHLNGQEQSSAPTTCGLQRRPCH